MRVLLRDSRDNTLLVVEAIEVNYDPSDSTLSVCLCTGEFFEISEIRRETADSIISDVYVGGRIDLSQYSAVYDDGRDDGDDDYEEDDADGGDIAEVGVWPEA